MPVGEYAPASNLAAVVDELRLDEVKPGVWWNQGVQVDHGAAVFPKPGSTSTSTAIRVRLAHDLSFRVNAEWNVAYTALEQLAEISQYAPAPEKPADDLDRKSVV